MACSSTQAWETKNAAGSNCGPRALRRADLGTVIDRETTSLGNWASLTVSQRVPVRVALYLDDCIGPGNKYPHGDSTKEDRGNNGPPHGAIEAGGSGSKPHDGGCKKPKVPRDPLAFAVQHLRGRRALCRSGA